MVFQRLTRRWRLPAALSLAVCFLFAAAGVVVPVPAVGAPGAGASALTLLAPADGSEVEPNNTCATAQNLGAIALPFSIRGSIDSRVGYRDVDFFRFTATPGSQLLPDLEGAATGQGTLTNAGSSSTTRPVTSASILRSAIRASCP